jgi:hypothetical protein
MKHFKFFVLSALIAGSVNAAETRFTPEALDVIEQNLTVALNHPIPGVQASAAQTVRDLKNIARDSDLNALVIPLMRIVKNGNAECGPRILAALALHDLNSGMGDFAIKRVGLLTDDCRLKHVCTWLTYDCLARQVAAGMTRGLKSN